MTSCIVASPIDINIFEMQCLKRYGRRLQPKFYHNRQHPVVFTISLFINCLNCGKIASTGLDIPIPWKALFTVKHSIWSQSICRMESTWVSIGELALIFCVICSWAYINLPATRAFFDGSGLHPLRGFVWRKSRENSVGFKCSWLQVRSQLKFTPEEEILLFLPFCKLGMNH